MCSLSSSVSSPEAASVDAARSTLCRLIMGLQEHQLRLLMRIVTRVRIGAEDREPTAGSPAILQKARHNLAEMLVDIASALFVSGRPS